MISAFVSFLKKLSLFTVVLLLINYGIVYLIKDYEVYYSPLSIHGFLFTITALIYILLLYVNKNFSDYTGYTFMGSSLFKMLLAVLFLLPVLLNKEISPMADLAAFFIPYFLYLIFETVFAVSLLNPSKDKPLKNQ